MAVVRIVGKLLSLNYCLQQRRTVIMADYEPHAMTRDSKKEFQVSGGVANEAHGEIKEAVGSAEHGTVIYHADGRCHIYMPEGVDQAPDTPRGERPANKSGYLWKKAGNMRPNSPRGLRRNWNKRWFTLEGPILRYHEFPAKTGQAFGPGTRFAAAESTDAACSPFFCSQARAKRYTRVISARRRQIVTAIS